MLLSSSSDSPASREGSGYITWACIRDVTPWLLQLSSGRHPRGYAQAAAVCKKCCCALDSRPQLAGSRDTRSTSAALVARAMAYPTQVVYYHAVHTHRTMSSLHDGVCSDHRQIRRKSLSNCAADVAGWCASRRLQLNADDGLRSSNSSLYVTPRLRTRFGEQAFSFAGPAAWNFLPAELID
jgi:hypothetical protein